MSDLAFCRLTERSTKPEVSRSGSQPMCTDTCTAIYLEGWLTELSQLRPRLIDRPTVQRALLSGSGHGRPGGRLVGQAQGMVNRAVSRHVPTIRNMIVGRSTNISFWPTVWPQWLIFWSLYNRAVLAVFYKIFSRFQSQFFPYFL